MRYNKNMWSLKENKSNIIIPCFVFAGFILSLGIVWFLAKGTQEDIEETVIEQFGRQEEVIAQQIAQMLEMEIAGVKEKLILISQIPEVRSGDSEACGAKLKEVSGVMKVPLGNLGRMNKDGLFYCGVRDSIIGVDGTRYDYLRKIIADPIHEPVLSRAVLFEYADRTEYLAALHVPVFDEGGEFLGTLGGAIYFDEIEEKYLGGVEVFEKGYVAVQDDNGDILYHPTTDLVGRNVHDEYMRKVLSESQELQELVEDAQTGKTGVTKYVYLGELKIATYRPAHVFEDRYWPVFVTATIAETEGVVAPLIANLQIRVFVIFSILALFTAGIIVFLMRMNRVLKKRVHERTAELNAAKQKIEAVLGSIGDGVFAIDREQNIIHLNARGEELSGFKADDVLGRPYYDVLKFVNEKEGSENIAFIRAALRGETGTMKEGTLLIRKDGKKLPIADTASPLKDEKGNIIGAVVVFRDASQEREIKRLRDELVYIAVHELRAPATALRAFLEMMSESADKLPADIREFLSSAIAANEQTRHLIDDLLEVSRSESGALTVEVGSVNLMPLIDATVQKLLPAAKQKNVRVQVAAAGDTPEVLGDSEKLTEVVTNLLSNAIKYNREGGSVDIRVFAQDSLLVTEVRDTGHGIPKEQQSKVFQRFFRAKKKETREVAGTGLGLFIARLLVEKMGGKIEFSSTEGKGSTFAFSLPIAG